MNFNFRGKAAARLVIEVDREAWPKAAEISIFAQQPTLDYRIGNLKPGESKITLDDLPPGTFNVALQNAGRELGGGRIQVDTLAHRQVVLKAGETVSFRFAKP